MKNEKSAFDFRRNLLLLHSRNHEKFLLCQRILKPHMAFL